MSAAVLVRTVGTCPIEETLLKMANIDYRSNTLTTDHIRQRAEELMAEVRKGLQTGGCCTKVAYRLGCSRFIKMEDIAHDLKLIATEIENRHPQSTLERIKGLGVDWF